MILRVLSLVALAGVLSGSTLEKLSLDDMIQKSTVIVRGRISGSYSDQRGAMIYTHYTVAVSEKYKGAAGAAVDAVSPGGVYRNLRQTVTGAPKLDQGAEYVFFLWTSKTGLNHIIGLSQGVFDVRTEASGKTTAVRGASTEAMVDPVTGKEIRDGDVRIPLTELRQRIARVLGGSKE